MSYIDPMPGTAVSIGPGGRRRSGPTQGLVSAGASGPGFTPASLPGLLFWTRADQGVGLSVGKASSWADQSGLGNNMTAGDANTSYVSAGAASYLSTDANGNMSLLLPVLSVSLRSLSVFLVYANQMHDNFTIDGVAQRHLFSTATAELLGYDCTAANATAWCMITNDHATRFGSLRLPASPSFIGFASGAAGHSHYVNDASAAFGAMANQTYNLKKLAGYFASSYSYGRFYAAMAYNRQLSASEVLSLKNYCYATYPAILQSPTTQVVFAGDSLTAGSFSTLGLNYPTQITYPWSVRTYNYGAPGQTAAQLSTYVAAQINGAFSASYSRNVCCLWIGTNDLDAATAPATVYSTLQSLCTSIQGAGFKVVVLTTLPRSSSSGTFEADRQTLNASIRSGFSGLTLACDAVADVGADATIGAAGSQNSGTYYSSDHIHLLNAGYLIVAGIVGTALAGLP